MRLNRNVNKGEENVFKRKMIMVTNQVSGAASESAPSAGSSVHHG